MMQDPTPKRNLEQRRAAHALERIQRVVQESDDDKKKYRSYVSALPANILMSGLGQALATIRSKDERAYKNLYDHLSDWLCREDAESPYNGGDLLTNITRHDEEAYLRAQHEAIAYLGWLKKLARAYLPKDSESPEPTP